MQRFSQRLGVVVAGLEPQRAARVGLKLFGRERITVNLPDSSRVTRAEDFTTARGLFEHPKGGSDAFNWQRCLREHGMCLATQCRMRLEGKDHAPAEPTERNISAIARLEHEAIHERSAGDRLSDTITRLTGSMPFALTHIVFFVGWVLLNLRVLDGVEPFDPFPFSFLTLIVSLEAIFLSVFVLMSQNRMTRQADKRAHLDLQVDLLAEQELTTMLQMLRALCAKLGVAVDVPEKRLRALTEETDVHKLMSTLEQKLPRR